MQPLTARRILLVCAALSLALLAAMTLSLRLGAYPMAFREILRVAASLVTGHTEQIPTQDTLVIFQLRLPRILLGIIVGAALSVAGSGFQALLRNPLADPYVLGVSSGAALGAILSLIVAPRTPLVMQVSAFAGAATTIAAVYVLGRRGGVLDSATLLLGGIVTASFLSAVILFLITTLNTRDLRGMTFWLAGDLSTPVTWNELGYLFAAMLLTVAAIYTTSADLNLILTGEQEAQHLGVNVSRVKLVVYIAASLLTGLAVSVSGAIGYVGLLVPHVMRMIFGSDHRVLIPASAFGGAIGIVLADTLARTVAAPNELPVGAMTAVAGAPVFIYLLRRRVR